MSKKVILGLHLSNRVNDATKVQDVLTKFGCSIRTRLGLHDASEDFCSPCGLIILELTGDKKEFTKMEAALKKITGLTVKKMEFEC